MAKCRHSISSTLIKSLLLSYSLLCPIKTNAFHVNIRPSFTTKSKPSSSLLYSSAQQQKQQQQQKNNASSRKGKQEVDFSYNPKKIRNFSIIAHIDHGKSTLADRILEQTQAVAQRDMQEQLLDTLDIERERGITVKLQAARVLYKADDGEEYVINLIDTPGHVDFTYEVSRSLAACEGALLVVDASQGIEAQTLANIFLALENDLEILPVLNKIDLPAADPDRVCEEIEETIGLDTSNIVLASAKSGIGIKDILEGIVKFIPPPVFKDEKENFRALIFDSLYDAYRGVIVFCRVMNGGEIKKGDTVRFLASGVEHEVVEVGVMMPQQVPVKSLRPGEVGYICAAIKDVMDARVGDTVVIASEHKALVKETNKGVPALPGYAPSIPVVYCGLFPVDADQYEALRDSLGKLRLNDASITYEPENSSAMGFGFRCGFLGLLHMEIVQERLSREYDIDLIVTAPSVVYKVKNLVTGEEQNIDSPSKMPDVTRDIETLEPYVKMEILTPSEYNGPIIELGQERRGILKDVKYLTPTRSTIIYELPLAEVITDFFDQLKSRTKGYASMEYTIIDYRASDLVRLDIKINGEEASPLACIVHRDASQKVGRALANSLKELIPRQLFKVPIQACIGVKIIASAVISPMRKDVLAKCYGGDLSRKKKLLQKQAKGKKRMKAMGKVNVPQEAFMAVLKLDRSGGGD